jgi:prepilin-type N-terminal cleavage/methylation domain-containing protein
MRVGGFTLIELLIVVAIMSLIAAVAIPSYSNQIRKNNRAVAKSRLAQASQLLERFYSDNSTYYVDMTSTPCGERLHEIDDAGLELRRQQYGLLRR